MTGDARPAGRTIGQRAGREDRAGQPLVTQVLSAIRRRKWIIIGALTASLVLGLIATLLMTPQYTAVSTLEIQRETGSFVNVEGAESKSSFVDQEFYQTQYGLLRSQALADRVATDLKLYDNVRFFEMFGAGKEWFEDGRMKANAPARDVRIRAAGGILLRNFVVRPARLSRLVGIEFTSPDPGLSKMVVDKWAVDFIQVTLERRYGATAYAKKFLEQRLAQLRQRIDSGQRQLVAYAGREGIVNLPGTGGTAGGAAAPERSLAASDLETLNAELTKATADRIQAESRINSSAGEVREALDNTAITSLRQKRAELSADYAKMMVQFEPGYPPARALSTQIDQLDRSISREEQRVTGSIRQTYQASLAREQDLKQRVEGLKEGVLDFRRRSIQYDIFQRDVDTSRQLYDALLQRYKEIGVAGGIGVNNIAVVDPAEYPSGPSSPRLFINMALALLVGMILGIGGALAAEQVDQGITDPSEVEDSLNVPLLGTIPKSAGGDVVEAIKDRKSALNEAYLSLQTNLAFSTSHGLPRTLAITSTRPAEGKTTTSFALARSLARSNHRVLLIDADMRSPSIHHLLDLDNAQGLSNYLSGSDKLDELIRASGFDNLSIMSAGPQPPSAPELLSSDRLERLIEELSSRFDQIVFDAPPVMGLADAPLVCSRMEGAIFVLESHSTQKSMAEVALARLETAGVNLFGVVLTKFDSKRAHYGYGYDYGYGYGYGDKAAQS